MSTLVSLVYTAPVCVARSCRVAVYKKVSEKGSPAATLYAKHSLGDTRQKLSSCDVARSGLHPNRGSARNATSGQEHVSSDEHVNSRCLTAVFISLARREINWPPYTPDPLDVPTRASPLSILCSPNPHSRFQKVIPGRGTRGPLQKHTPWAPGVRTDKHLYLPSAPTLDGASSASTLVCFQTSYLKIRHNFSHSYLQER